ncbi:ACP S-malonyltransferase [Streptomyces sp. N35]|uniref:ACP S-malonyltransferase n=1 Tax=Streptomyces sp. N35 TaxID=2795730 RepID=UPI0018F6F875|nr:acyltransferase domain-containing protein [Streptomyces sp. N35]
MTPRAAFLFPGQGAYLPGILTRTAPEVPSVQGVLEEIDEAAGTDPASGVTHLLTDTGAPPPPVPLARSPLQLDLALFAGALAAYHVIRAMGVRPDVLAGHSFGELAALTASGALTLQDATRFIVTRDVAFRKAAPPAGGMLAVPLDGRRTAHLVGLLDDPTLTLAVENGPDDCVVSGPADALARAVRVSRALGIDTAEVPAAYPFHNPVLRDVADELAHRTAEWTVSEPRTAVFSAALGGRITTESEVRLLAAQHLVRPVLFYDGLRQLHRDGIRTFVECGPRTLLTRLVKAALPPGVTTVAPLDRRRTPAEVAAALDGASLPAAWPAGGATS